MKNKLLLVLCLFMFSIGIKVNAVSSPCCENGERTINDAYGCAQCRNCTAGACPTTKYCCNGKESDSPISGQKCGKKSGRCEVTLNPTTIKSSPSVQKMSKGDSASIIGAVGNCKISNNSGGVVSADKTSMSVVREPLNNQCSQDISISYTCTNSTINGNGVRVNSSASGTFTFKVIASWAGSAEKNKEIWSRNAPSPTSKNDANSQGKNVAYVGCKQDDKIKSKWTCPEVWKRGCSVPTPELPGCYKEKSTGFYYWGFYGGNNNYTHVSSITSYKACVSKFECTTKYPDKKDTETPCNGEGLLKGTYTKKCDSIYEIKCEEKVRTKFDGPVLDSSMKEENNAYLYPSTGFKYKFTAVSTLSCNGTFDNNRYNAVENYIRNYASQIGGSSTGDIDLDDKFYTNALSGLQAIKKSYTDWKPNYVSKASVTISDTVNNKPNRPAVTLNNVGDDLIKITPSCGSLPNGKTVNFNYVEQNAIEKEMPSAYLERGKILYQSGVGAPCTNCSFVGKKYFVDENYDYTDSKKYTYNYVVNATSLGYGGYGSDKTTCNLKLVDNRLIYRHVDLNDPFLQKNNSSHKIGYNWSNSKYNFVKVIKPGVWSGSSMYNTISLDPDTNSAIKSSTKNNPNYYVGACTNGLAKNTDIICKLLRNAQK